MRHANVEAMTKIVDIISDVEIHEDMPHALDTILTATCTIMIASGVEREHLISAVNKFWPEVEHAFAQVDRALLVANSIVSSKRCGTSMN